MLEKIGLPAKPSARGASWVVDASNCQGCSAQFSFLTRKHHCQRCGGLFCSSCTQQRMVLRGQGESPVRICDPCKKLEEAARFELRYGHKSRAAKANPNLVSNPEDEVISEILGADGKQPRLSGRDLDPVLSDLGRTESTASSSGSRRTPATISIDGGRNANISTEVDGDGLEQTGSIFTPEELRQQAAEDKKRYKTLKSEGKSDEALQAFKHGKELERQAAALEMELRKHRRMASKAPNVATVVSTQKRDDSEDAQIKKASGGKRLKKEKDDIASELRDLGWADADLHEDTKPQGLGVEGELSQLLREVAPKSSEGKKTGGIDKSQVNALKRQALILKREGRLAEAKEELKKAKLLEKQLEEQEILGEEEESDDELAALIRNMGDDNQDDLLLDDPTFPRFNFEHIMGAPDDLPVDGNFDVTDDDMNDPDLAAALKSFGWSEDDDGEADIHGVVSPPLDQDALKEKVLTLKREAVAQKRAGNVAEAMSLLKKAKLLEKDLETEELGSKVPSSEVGRRDAQAEEGTVAETNVHAVSAPKSKLAIQRELLALKKRALALRREGKVHEAEDELKKGTVLERQLEELESASTKPAAKESKKNFESTPAYKDHSAILDLEDEGYEPEVTDNDMRDPALISVLKNMGWEDDEGDSMSRTDKPFNPSTALARKPAKSKGQIQKELLSIKRKALALRREGKNAEAEEELEKAKILEQQMAEIEESANSNVTQQDAHGFEHPTRKKKFDDQHDTSIDAGILPSSLSNTIEEKVSPPWQAAEFGTLVSTMTSSPTKAQLEATVPRQPGHAAKESFDKMYAVLSQSGHSDFSDLLDTAKGSLLPPDELEEPQPRIIVKQQESAVGGRRALPPPVPNVHKTEEKESMARPKSTSRPEEKVTQGGDTLKDEILLHKRKAVALKREGKLVEAREELKQAKLLEKHLGDAQQTSADSGDPSASTSTVQDNKLNQPVTISTREASASAPILQDNNPSPPKKAMSSRDRLRIQRESLAHKRNALKLRREGKIAEADAEFELAKSLESQLEDSDSQALNPTSKPDEANDAAVEGLLDPQIMSALKSIGWGDTDLFTQPPAAQRPKRAEVKPNTNVASNSQNERTELEEQIKAEKLKALRLKREGKQAEALEALRAAKRLEKKLDSLS